MGFLDDMLGKLGGDQGQEGGLNSMKKLFSEGGGLEGLTQKLTSSGLGQQVQSWVGTGENEPVTGAQVQQAMDQGTLNQMAEQAHMTPEETSENVAQVLPEMVNEATPQGQIPDNDPFAKGLDALKKMFKV